MNHSWSLYGYVRRWRVVLVFGLILGALLGLAWDYSREDSESYTARVGVHLRLPSDPGSIPHIHFDIISDLSQTEIAAAENVTSKLESFLAFTNVPIVYEIRPIERSTSGALWWKAVVLGSVLGTLLVIAGISLWEDVRAYHRDHQQDEPET